MLKELTDAVEQHNAHGLRVHADGERAQGGNAHQEVFIENLSMGNIFRSGQKDACAQNQIADDKYRQRYHRSSAGVAQHLTDHEKDCADDDGNQFSAFLFFLILCRSCSFI